MKLVTDKQIQYIPLVEYPQPAQATSVKADTIEYTVDNYDGIYIGELNDAKVPHGHGKFTIPNEYIYEGQWVNGQRRGLCKEFFPDGTTFEGEVKNGIPYGHGKLVLADGTTYEGSYINGKQGGKAKLVFPGGDSFEGDFTNGKRHGLGQYNYKDGTVYSGEWKYDKRHGDGEEIFPDGARFEGSFKDGKRCGIGKFHFKDGCYYANYWSNDKVTNYGIFHFTSENKAYGLWKRDVYPLPDVSNLPELTHTSNPSIETKIAKLTHPKSGLSVNDVKTIWEIIEQNTKNLQLLQPGMCVRMRKNYNSGPTRTLLAVKERAVDPDIYILCKKKITLIKSGPISSTSIPGETVTKIDKAVAKGTFKTLTLAYHTKTGEPFAYLSTVADWSGDGYIQTLKEIRYYKLFAGIRGFLPTGPRAVHYYTKKCKDSNDFELKIGYLLPYIPNGDLYHYVFNKNNAPSKLTRIQFLNCFMDIASTLKALEENKVVHGDIAWTNFLISQGKDNKDIKLICIDFGISNNENDIHLFEHGQLRFRSPERIFYGNPMKNEESRQFIRKHAHGVDIWGAGICLLILMGMHDNSIFKEIDGYLDFIKNLPSKNTEPTQSFEDFCKTTFLRHDEVLSLFENDDDKRPEISLVKRMLELDPAKRPSGIEIYNEVSRLLRNVDSNCSYL